MNTDRGALVLGANYRALGIARSLGRRGIPTWVLMAPGDDQIARSSRYVQRSLTAPTDDDRWCDGLVALATRHGLERWTLFPTDDESAALVARHHETLVSRLALTSPGWNVYRHAYHKRLTNALAEQAGRRLTAVLACRVLAFSLLDPVPFIATMWHLVSETARGRWQRVRRRQAPDSAQRLAARIEPTAAVK